VKEGIVGTILESPIMTAKKEAVVKKGAGSKKETHQKSRLYDSFQEEIANTYFKASPSTGKKAAKKRASKIPWIIAVFAACLAVAIFVSRSNFDIKVRLVSGTPFITKDASALPMDGAQFFVRGGEPNKSIVGKSFFVGDARVSSKMADSEITLSNSRGQGWASFVIEMKQPIDLTRLDIRYTAKGSSGAEKLVPIIIDSQNRSYRIGEESLISLSDDWHAYIIDFQPVKGDIDLKNVSAIKFEFGTETAGNGPAAAIFLKDIAVTKARRIKWL
jgi:hypothetical protein